MADDDYIKSEGSAKRMRAQLMAVVLEGDGCREYVAPTTEHVAVAQSVSLPDDLHQQLPYEPRAIWCTLYGLTEYRDLFTPRQLTTLITFSDLVGTAREQVLADAKKTMADDGIRLVDGGKGASAYADAIATYLAFAVDRSADAWSSVASWRSSVGAARTTFARQALPMAWDFAEVNPFGGAGGDWMTASVQWIVKNLRVLRPAAHADVRQLDARSLASSQKTVVSTDPPYYDNIGYADLSDFFYVWLRRSLKNIYPEICSTLLTPKDQELVASRYRLNGDAEAAREFFESGMRQVFAKLRGIHDHRFPMTVFYAFKQSEDDENGEDGLISQASTGWETMLEGIVRNGFAISGTWPLRTEKKGRSISIGANALASSIVLACRPRPEEASIATRREFIAALKRELPIALKQMTDNNIAAVDLAQAAIGPGMSIFSRHSKVVESDGNPMSVRSALQLINQTLYELQSEQDAELDRDTQWCVAWFIDYGLSQGDSGTAELLANAKNTSIRGLETAGVIDATKGKVRLLRRDELDDSWDPAKDKRLTIWEATHHLIVSLERRGESGAAQLLRKLGGMGETVRLLAYRLYLIAQHKEWSDDAMAYNSVVVAWPDISRLASEFGKQSADGQMTLR